MSRPPLSSATRLRVRLACAGALALLCAACGPGGPKRETGNSTGGGSSSSNSGITLVAGNATLAGTTNDQGSSARFSSPRGIAIDSSGNLYVADQGNFAIRKIATDGTVSTFAGRIGSSGSANGNGGNARFSQPTGLTIDASGNLFVTDGYLIRKITPSADVTTVYTVPSGNGFGGDNQFMPGGIAVDGADNLYVATGADTRRITASSYTATTTLEQGTDFHYDSGNDVLLQRGVAVDASNVVYVAALDNTIKSATSSARALSAFAGMSGTSGSANGNAGNTSFGDVVALTVDQDGNLYAADQLDFTIRKITSKAVTSTVAGVAGRNAYGTGGLPGSLTTLGGITNDGKGNLYVTEGQAVVKIAQ